MAAVIEISNVNGITLADLRALIKRADQLKVSEHEVLGAWGPTPGITTKLWLNLDGVVKRKLPPVKRVDKQKPMRYARHKRSTTS